MRDANKRRKLESTSSQLYWPRDETGWQTNSSRAPSKATAPPPASRPAMTAPLAPTTTCSVGKPPHAVFTFRSQFVQPTGGVGWGGWMLGGSEGALMVATC